ncbi:hypothetical protein VTJ49DRAFT_3950 [Mycothermus thermophilus]|uniref:OsmC family protein n=1 Tax=Humicola insolens TaxID=85995 RepID=A0ABR3V6H9_HUMIN
MTSTCLLLLRSLTRRQPRLSNPTRLFTTTPHRRLPSTTLPVTITATGTGTLQHISIPGKPYTFTSDTYPLLGGSDSAPSPVVYSLAALSACTQVTGHVVARDRGIKLGEWDVHVEGRLPTGTLVKGEEGDPNWEQVIMKIRVQTDVGNDEFGQFVYEVERRCPITALFRKSGMWYESVWVNERVEGL